ncbi:P-loop containing nucleoside triphosphatehydrolases superfamily protein [Striga asiatica]|uniref:quinolinate synthase n=1 Tax=Striga asiatica TaxID=4170 RepID=A0A5A7P0A4_STRAF|nr:P-loop containing nucleoside triphosphatehydrolases superfamily protein [Striga asiatica]
MSDSMGFPPGNPSGKPPDPTTTLFPSIQEAYVASSSKDIKTTPHPIGPHPPGPADAAGGVVIWVAPILKNKRGRPRKYGPDGSVAAKALSPMPISSSASPPVIEFFAAEKRGKVRSVTLPAKVPEPLRVEYDGLGKRNGIYRIAYERIGCSLADTASSPAYMDYLSAAASNVVPTILQMTVISDEEVASVHPRHNRRRGHVNKIKEMYCDLFLTAHFEAPFEMFSLAMEAKRRGMGVVASTQNILDFIKERLQEALDRKIDNHLQYFTGLLTPWKGILLFGPLGTGKDSKRKEDPVARRASDKKDLLKSHAQFEGFDFQRNKRVAMGLSYWIVQHDATIKGSKRKPHIRLTFF